MYYVFQEENEVDAVLFTETCETEEELNELLASPTMPVMFVYNDITGMYSHSNGHYDLDESRLIVNSALK